MKTLAIKGDESRGEEIKEILESLGGHDYNRLIFSDKRILYYVPANDNKITCNYISHVDVDDFEIFTIDEFKEKFKFKVGDLVRLGETPDEIYTITSTRWDYEYGEVMYEIDGVHGDWYRYCLLISIEKKCMTQEVPKSTRLIDNLDIVEVRDNEVEIVLDSCDNIDIKDNIIRIIRKPQYPKTFEECCDILRIYYTESTDVGYEFKLLRKLRRLLICRDAYWKIAGEQMGLGKPWEPDWLNKEQDKFVLYTHNNVICSNHFVLGHNVLAFPTEEMRDTFYENFKDSIESCKELL